MISGGAFEGSVDEGLFLRFTCRAECGLVELVVGWLSGKVAFTGSHLVDARRLEFTEAHENVWFGWNWELIRGSWVELSPFFVKGHL
jgi:hypothetical protein